MSIPLYSPNGWSARTCNRAANRGLVFDKYFDGWNSTFDGLESKERSKRDWLKRFSGAIPLEAAARAAARQCELVKALGGCAWTVEATSRFVTGTGIDNPLENGFVWHHTLGVPYLPASGLKGALRSYLKQWSDPKKSSENSALASRLLGDMSAKTAGGAILFDMLPTANLRLSADVMTPHYDEWYAEGKPPGDWISPNPIPFLVVEAGSRFEIGIAPRDRKAVDPEDMKALRPLIGETLEWIGLGAKTAVGYGRFQAVA